jgi:capsular polysaccharide biosynthesis protein/Mrp family chromosome partitioning ATPase
VELSDYLRLLRGRWRLIVLSVVFGLVVGAAYHESRSPIYNSTTTILLQPYAQVPQLSNTGTNSATVDPVRYATDQLSVISSDPVSNAAAAQVGGGISGAQLQNMISVSNSSSTDDVLTVTAKSSDATQAARIANGLAKAYLVFQKQSAVNQLKAGVSSLQSELDTLSSTIIQLQKGASSNISLQAAQQQYQTLYAEQAQLSSDIGLENGNAQVLSAAQIPTAPAGLSLIKTGVLGGILGLLLGALIVIIRDQLDHRIRNVVDLQRLAGSTATLDLTGGGGPRSASAVEDSLRRLSAIVQGGREPSGRLLVVVSSPVTTNRRQIVSEGLALAFSKSKNPTVLVCTDRASEGLYRFQPPTPTRSFRSLADLALSRSTEEPGHTLAAITKALYDPALPDLRIVPLDKFTPPEFLASPQTRLLLDVLADGFSTVVVDAAPYLEASDALSLGEVSSGLVLVATQRETTREDVSDSLASVQLGGIPVLAVVLVSDSGRQPPFRRLSLNPLSRSE